MTTPTTTKRLGSWSVAAATFLIAAITAAAAPLGPIAITMAEGATALLLRSDGRINRFDTVRATVGAEFFRVPTGFIATDMAAAAPPSGLVTCLMLNARAASTYSSFVMQVFPNGRQVWSWLPAKGVYIGVAIDAAAQYAYATNATTNVIYRVTIGDEKAPVPEVAYVSGADRIGAIVVDDQGQRLFATDMVSGRLYIISLTSTPRQRTIELPGSGEVRALAWSPTSRRLLLADAGQETVWSIDPDGGVAPIAMKDRRMREPSGLTITRDGRVLGVDEGARAVFELSNPPRTVSRFTKLD